MILETLVDFYKNQTNESLCNSVFKTMFHAGMYDGRKELLYRLVSMAVGVECSHLLNSAAVWMQVSSTTHVHAFVLQCVIFIVQLSRSNVWIC